MSADRPITTRQYCPDYVDAACELDKATNYLVRRTNATGFPSMERNLLEEIRQSAIHTEAANDDWQTATFHDGSRLRIKVDAEGEMHMERQTRP